MVEDADERERPFETVATTPGGPESPGTDGQPTEVQVAAFPAGVAIRLNTEDQNMLALLTPEQTEELRGELAKAVTETDAESVVKRQEYIDLFGKATRLE